MSQADDLRIDTARRARLAAAVFDANAYKSSPDLSNLAANAFRLHLVGLETWIPEAVALEWAEHLVTDWREIGTAAQEQRKRLRRAGLAAPESPYGSGSDLETAFLERLRSIPHLRVIPIEPANALEALKDQILLRGPGKRKGGVDGSQGVKTGASDSVWMRDVLSEVGGDAERLLIVSEDRDVPRTLAEWGYHSVLIRARRDLRSSLFEVVLDDRDAMVVVLEYLRKTLPTAQMLPGGAEPEGALDVGDTTSLERAIEEEVDDWQDTRVYGAGLTSINALAGIVQVFSSHEVIDPREFFGEDRGFEAELGAVVRHSIDARVLLLADAQATVSRIDSSGDSYTDIIEPVGVLVRTDLSFLIVEGRVVSVQPEDDAYVSLGREKYSSPEDALAAFAEALSSVPGLVDVEDWLIGERSLENTWEAQLFESAAVLRIAATQHDFWEFELELEAESISVSCEYDPSARVWDGRESFDYYPPFYVATDHVEFSAANPVWGIASWVMRAVYTR